MDKYVYILIKQKNTRSKELLNVLVANRTLPYTLFRKNSNIQKGRNY